MSINVNEIKGVVLGYRRSRATQYNNQVLVKLFVNPKIIPSVIGAKVIARDDHNNIYRGKIVKVHSFKNSIVVVKFKPNIPGQLIGKPAIAFKK